ncbi:hypothetical protein DCAR_0520842 [Daucus carota subsp. sativus]|uniref:Replication factor C subunit 1 n=1 Tax=Daucus carota subsp. sativus TaxID=79200 RepID=A0AAF0X4I8_DAUCS|nr:PREDICTED: replication factor C subunit 1 [Daucus carota subsp. sativus]XP_017252681.1 PREDICTED: replication factor C subunit 1 [Daucus carota subsp. sativus]WOH01458.1 hypothetical protein DCAR_0520842 [Daucus carota subsp. sativus]
MSSDIRKWFMKHNDNKGNGNASKDKLENPEKPDKQEKSGREGQESSGRRKCSPYFDKQKIKNEKEIEEPKSETKTPIRKKLQKVEDAEDDDDFEMPSSKRKGLVEVTPNKRSKSGVGRGAAKKGIDLDESDEDDVKVKATKSTPKSAGRGRGGKAVSVATKDESDDDDAEDKDTKSQKPGGRGRGGRGTSAAAPGGGRGRGGGGGGRGGFMNFGERKDPPHKGEKEVPEGAPNCLANLTFVISGTLDSLEREEAEDLIKRHGGRITGSVSKKTNYLLCDEDIGGRKSSKAKELGTGFLTEDGLFDMIRASKPSPATAQNETKKSIEKTVASTPKSSPQQLAISKEQARISPVKNSINKGRGQSASPAKKKSQSTEHPSLSWTEKYKPKVPTDIIGNQSLVKQLHEWLVQWNEQFLNTGHKGKGKKPINAGAKKAVLLSGTPGIGKTTSAKLVSQMLGYVTVEVNASDSRGKADGKIEKGIGGSTANSIKELVSNEALSVKMDRPKHQKTVLVMDEVDGMSAGDRGGVADLIASIKISKIPIICICNDRYSQKLKSLVNHCLLLNYRKPTKQQMAKRLAQIANAEGLKADEIALEELAERVNGDMRMALNQLQYMSLSKSVIKYDDIRQRLLSSSKDEDISPFTAVDKLFGFNAGKLGIDERVNLSMSDPDLVPLIIQENYVNYKPSSAGRDDNGLKRMSLIARAAESIADGDIINVQIRRYRQWQLSQSSSLSSCIIPAALLHGQREILEQGERNFNRFGGWLGRNSTMGKNYRLLDDLHVHLLAARESNLGRTTLRLDYLTLLLKNLTDPLRMLPKDEAVEKVVEFMDSYSISQEDFDAIVEISKFQGHPNPLEGILPAVKAALTKAYNKGSKSRVIRTADLITLPGLKKAPKKRIAAMLEPADDGLEGKADEAENEEGNSSDEELDDKNDGGKAVQLDLQNLSSKGIQVQMDLKGAEKTSGKKTGSGRGKRGASEVVEKGAGRGSGSAAKRKK